MWLSLLLAAIVVAKAVDMIQDRALALPAQHLMQEGVLLLVSALACVYLIYDMRRRSRALRQLRESLSLSDARLASLDGELRRARREHGEAIQRQFRDWGLTASEREIAMLLLKGFSLREIAALRQTHEKTVRQHASHVYAKSGLEGRHALAAWFLEDFISP